MHVSVQVSKRRHNSRMHGIVDIEDEGSAYVMVIREQYAARRHYVFCVMDPHGLLIRRQGSNQPAIRSGSRI